MSKITILFFISCCLLLVVHNLCIPRSGSRIASTSGSAAPPSSNTYSGSSQPSGSAAPVPAPAPSASEPQSNTSPSQSSPSPSQTSSASSSSPSSTSSTSSSGGSLGSGARKGKASYYTEWSSNPGSCGFIPNQEDIAAIHPSFMPSKCNQCIMINYGGKQLKVKVTDTCPGCDVNKIDLSDKAFAKLDSLSKGILDITWDFVSC